MASLAAEGQEDRQRLLGIQWKERQLLRGPRPESVCYTCGSNLHLARDCNETVCHFCGRRGHLARFCTFGTSLAPRDQFILCELLEEQSKSLRGTPCFVRRFLMPLHAANPDFNLEDLTAGRVDVGCRSVTAALFRSESYRRNTEIRLTFCGAEAVGDEADPGHTAVLTGGLIRGLRPDERSVAARLKLVLKQSLSDAAAEMEGARPQRQSLGARCISGGWRGSVEEALAGAARTSILLLAADGEDIEASLKDLRERWLRPTGDAETPDVAGGTPNQVLVILGDDRGLTQSQEAAVEELAKQRNECEVLRVSLGPEVLLGSHCIVLVQHWLDRMLHCCPGKLFDVAPEIAKSRKQRQTRMKRK